MTVTSPPAWVTTVSYPITVPVIKQVTDLGLLPSGVSDATALSYVTFSTSSLTFGGGGQAQSLTVQVKFPLGTVPGSYGYKLLTDWGSNYPLRNAINYGSEINASISVDNPAPQPPTVVISTPVDGSSVSVRPSQVLQGYTVTVNYTASDTSTNPSVIDTISAKYSTSSSGGGIGFGVSTEGINTASVSGTGTFQVTAKGTYYVTVTAHNVGGYGSDINSFIINVDATAPTVAITEPTTDPDYTWFDGDPLVEIANSFVGNVTETGNKIQGFRAQLTYPGTPANVSNLVISGATGLGTAQATAKTQLDLSSPPGQYTLTVWSYDEYNTSLPASQTFWVNRVKNPASLTVDAFQNASFSIVAEGRSSYTYQWYRVRGATTVALANDSVYSGVTSSTLGITRAIGSMSGDQFYCLITIAGTSPARTITTAKATLTVNKLQPTVTWTTPASIVYGTNLSTVTLSAKAYYNGAEVLGTMAYSPNSGVLPAGNNTLTANFTPNDAVNYNNATGTTTLVVTKATPVITWANPASITSGTALSSTQLNATASVPGTFAYTPAAGVVLGVGSQTLSVTFTPTDSQNYSSATKTVTLTVTGSTSTPPTVVINTPALGATYTLPSTGQALSVPLKFTGTSTTAGVGISDLTAIVSGTGATLATLTKTGLTTATAIGTATIAVTRAGTFTITVTAKDANNGTATATRQFVVNATARYAVNGTVFFDVNYNGIFDRDDGCDDDDYDRDDDHHRCSYDDNWDDCRGSRTDRYSDRGGCRDYGDRYYSCDGADNDDEMSAEDFGLGGVTVKLYKTSYFSRQLLATAITGPDGSYCFNDLAAGSYVVSAVEPAGYDATTQMERTVTVSSKNVVVRDIGFGLDFDRIRNHCASGKSHDFWHTQIDKCIKGETYGAQINAANCRAYTEKIGCLSLTVFDRISMTAARSTLASTSWASRDRLAKQLIAAEYNYANGAYINGNKTLTYCFIQWGERVHKCTTSYSSSYVQWAAAWFEAYNNSNGGQVCGPR